MAVPPFHPGPHPGLDPIVAAFALNRAGEAIDVLDARSGFGTETWCVAAIEEAVTQLEKLIDAAEPASGAATAGPPAGAVANCIADALMDSAYEPTLEGARELIVDMRAIAARSSTPGRANSVVKEAMERLRKTVKDLPA